MTVSTVNANLVNKVWAKKLFADVQEESYFQTHGFIGESPNSIIQKRTELAKAKGDQITVGLTVNLSGSGITGDNTLEGQEEAITGYHQAITVDQIRHAVRLAGKLNEQKAAYDMRMDAKEKLKTWMAEYLDSLFFDTLGASSVATRRVFCSADHSSVATLDATDLLTCAYISKAKRMAEMASPKVRPIMIKGKPHYVLVVDPYMARDLKADTTWINAQQYAGVRSDDNPLFSGALGMWDGVIVHEHEHVKRAADGDSGAYVGYGLFLGQQAGVWAVAQEPYWVEKEFDYDNQVGFATGLIHGFAKTVFNSVDYGLITMHASSAAD